MKKNLSGALLTIFGGICWGLSGSMGQYLFSVEGMDSRWLVPIRLFCAGILLFIYCLIKHRDKLFSIWTEKKYAFLLLAYGLTGVSLCQYTYFRCIQFSSAAVGTILQDLSPILILLCGCLITKRLPRTREIMSLIFAILGVALIVTHGDISNMVVPPRALAMGLICACAVTVYNMLTGPLTEKYPVPVLQAWAFVLGGILTCLLFKSWHIEYHPTPMGYFGIVFVIIVGNVLAFTTYIKGVQLIGPGKGILYGFSEPIIAAIIGRFLFKTPFTMWDMVGFACIFVMLVLISTARKNSPGNQA